MNIEHAKNLSHDLTEKERYDFILTEFKKNVQDLNDWIKELNREKTEIIVLLNLTDSGFCKGIQIDLYGKL